MCKSPHLMQLRLVVPHREVFTLLLARIERQEHVTFVHQRMDLDAVLCLQQTVGNSHSEDHRQNQLLSQ